LSSCPPPPEFHCPQTTSWRYFQVESTRASSFSSHLLVFVESHTFFFPNDPVEAAVSLMLFVFFRSVTVLVRVSPVLYSAIISSLPPVCPFLSVDAMAGMIFEDRRCVLVPRSAPIVGFSLWEALKNFFLTLQTPLEGCPIPRTGN